MGIVPNPTLHVLFSEAFSTFSFSTTIPADPQVCMSLAEGSFWSYRFDRSITFLRNAPVHMMN